MKKIGVIGAGVMGVGVAHNVAQAGYDVVLVDLTQEILARAEKEIHKNLRFQAFFKKGSVNIDATIGRIRFTTDYQDLHDTDYVVENVREKWEEKAGVYPRLEEICPAHCICAANTSCISITRIASLTRRPEKVIGIHFMNPVHLKPAVEVIRGHRTSQETIDKTGTFLNSIGKEYILVNDLPGFVSNRLSHLLMNEAAFVVQDQVAAPAEVDEIFRKCYGHKMGPLETADLIGLDTVVDSLDVLYESYQDSKFRCCPLLRKMVHAGQLGRKSGQGFYTYPDAATQ